jgi:hypothetical protein
MGWAWYLANDFQYGIRASFWLLLHFVHNEFSSMCIQVLTKFLLLLLLLLRGVGWLVDCSGSS